ncbi:hypothetical protein ACFXTH_035866 [Malus domestica]
MMLNLCVLVIWERKKDGKAELFHLLPQISRALSQARTLAFASESESLCFPLLIVVSFELSVFGAWWIPASSAAVKP